MFSTFRAVIKKLILGKRDQLYKKNDKNQKIIKSSLEHFSFENFFHMTLNFRALVE